MTDALSHALDAMFAEPLNPEGGGGFAAPAPIKGGRKWARLLIGAMTEQGGSYGGVRFNCSNPITLSAVPLAEGLVNLRGEGDIWIRYTVGEHSVSAAAVLPHLDSPILAALFTIGFKAGSTTTRAASPTDITLTLEGDTVRVEFSPPLKVSKSVLSFSVARVNVEETQLHIVVDGFLGKDQVLKLGE